MLFNSYPFLFVFLPVTLVGYQIAGHFHRKAVVAWLGLMSLVFYACWHPAFLVVLLLSVAVNYTIAGLISRNIANQFASRGWLWVGILLNLGALGYFKYFVRILNFASYAAGSSKHWADIVLPLGISFFTFTQIAYLVDLQQGVATLQDLSSYVLFVTFFPHLIAGPILHHKEMMPQFQQSRRYQLRLSDVAVGLSWFIMGLGKKVLLADTFSETAKSAFAVHGPLPAMLAWRGALCYALQLYFDFSGYSDMALGLARMFSIDFPLNFSSPYKAKNIIDFWQRWHITLSSYITTYLFNPIQIWISARRQKMGKKVSRKALATPEGFISMVAFPTLVTMFIAGIWHGAGLQFIVFGVLHGSYLTVNHGWRIFRHNRLGAAAADSRGPLARAVGHGSSVALTFFCVLLSLVFFRASSCGHAISIVSGMLMAHGGLSTWMFGDETRGKAALDLLCMLLGFVIVWGLPNTQQILGRFKPALQVTAWDKDEAPARGLWSPRFGWAFTMGAIFFLALVHIQDPSTFLYFQF